MRFELKKRLIPRYFLTAVLVCFTMIIFVQNFVYSSDFATLSLRCMDDVAFHESLYNYHSRLGTKQLLFMNDYGYGWIYWFPIYIVTYIGHLLFEAAGVSWLLIILPRMYSLFFCVMCSVLCYKIICIYTENEWIRSAVVLLMPLFPAGGYFAGRFSTVPQTAFFSMLAVYLVVKNEDLDRKKLRGALSAFAFAMATKTSAIVTAPLLILLVLARYGWRFRWKDIKVWIQEALLAVIVMLAAMSPIILLAPLDIQAAKDSWHILLGYWTKNQGMADMMTNLTQSTTFTMTGKMAMLLCAGLILLIVRGIWKLKQDRSSVIYWDQVLIPIGYCIGTAYLSLSITSGPTYVYMYATSISFILPFGLLIFEELGNFRWKIGKNLVSVIAVVFCFWQLGTINSIIKVKGANNVMRYFQQGAESKKEAESIRKMEQAVEQLGMQEVNYFADHTGAYSFYNRFEHDDMGYSFVLWDDLGKNEDAGVNLIVLAKNSIGFYGDKEFQDTVSRADAVKQEEMKADREARNMLVKEGIYSGYAWQLVYEDEFAYIFQKENE